MQQGKKNLFAYGFLLILIILLIFIFAYFLSKKTVWNIDTSRIAIDKQQTSVNYSDLQIQVEKTQREQAEEIGLKRIKLLQEGNYFGLYDILHSDCKKNISKESFIASFKTKYNDQLITNPEIKRVLFYEGMFFEKPQKKYTTVANIVVNFDLKTKAGLNLTKTNDGSWFFAWENGQWHMLWFGDK